MAELRAMQKANRCRVLNTLTAKGTEGATEEVRRDCSDLLFMLKGQAGKPEVNTSSAGEERKKHMMVSYAWAQKQRVKKLYA
mmetsp:Transcript_46189/g.92325  ORF Transcript_46189/g.92325 Transcript_46189/m.92325 type:complete len:82 (+) Transcript_46189:359-604(+)